MHESSIKYVDAKAALDVLAHWGGLKTSVQHLADSASSVFSFERANRDKTILKFTDATFRTEQEIAAEISFLNYLKETGADVCAALESVDEEVMIRYTDLNGADFWVVAYEFAGQAGADQFTEQMVTAWGKSLGQLHHYSKQLNAAGKGLELWQWNNEILFRYLGELIPLADVELRPKIDSIMKACAQLEKSQDTMGLIHGDFGPQNFHYAADVDTLSIFDFGNSCYHFYLYDVAVSLSVIERQKNAERNRHLFLQAYQDFALLPSSYEEGLKLLQQLRSVYVYLDRLYVKRKNSLHHGGIDYLDTIRQNILQNRAWWQEGFV